MLLEHPGVLVGACCIAANFVYSGVTLPPPREGTTMYEQINTQVLALSKSFADTALILAITNRGQKFTAPEQVRPNGRWKTREDLLASFEKARAATIEYLKANKADLRATFIQTPMGALDSYQGLLFLTGHSDRHLAQLKEVKADSKYPKN